MYRIGEFSSITGLSVKTLRYYDEIGLLKPSTIDKYTNYRYYDEKEIQEFKRIEYLKKIGFTLEEIKNNLKSISIETLDKKLKELELKKDYIIYQINELNSFKEGLINNKVKTIGRY